MSKMNPHLRTLIGHIIKMRLSNLSQNYRLKRITHINNHKPTKNHKKNKNN